EAEGAVSRVAMRALDWVIVGGESGGPPERALAQPTTGTARWAAKGRPCKEDAPLQWVRAIRDQCQAAGVAFHFKQWGGPRPKSGGRLLDGREWNEFPS
ncbi:MAG TPA: hypothetical protein DIW61_00535, partial [Candidatus Aminicenantes bacterium]|nr:hypothetical protein [Candidatus Aminicenantes bacterium]